VRNGTRGIADHRASLIDGVTPADRKRFEELDALLAKNPNDQPGRPKGSTSNADARREEHAALMRDRSKTAQRRETYLRNTTPERRSEIARNAYLHRKDVA
jgi:hypothetical protein